MTQSDAIGLDGARPPEDRTPRSARATPPELPQLFRQAMRRLVASVCILTTRDAHGTAIGMSATAVTSLTADPPALLMCVNRAASMHASLTIGRPVAVHILGAEHGELCFVFGGRATPAERFASGDWTLRDQDMPVLEAAQANLFCTVDALHAYGTHSIVVAKVDAVRIGGSIRPLVFVDGRIATVTDYHQ
ncbi:flavin reductase family protein [Sphingomonadaceae bacterium jetA1]|uniref:flavin reductase family protein n=1 Tax=Facivitalis istanbulensis TaxID=3075838 RepID=UPI00348A68E8